MLPIKNPKKLIEVALPLDDINIAAVREKSLRHGNPSTLHLWWARRPMAAARAVIFAQMVNDPGYERHLGRGVNKREAEKERERLFDIIRKLVVWENTNNENVLNEARAEIWKSWRETCDLNKNHPQAADLFNPEKLPAFHDPFAGGGALPLEAQRLGLESYASDLNPVAVLINKAMIEIPPKFAGRKPVGPIPEGVWQTTIAEDWSGAKGLAEDVRRYGRWMRDEAFKRIGHLYPQVEITAEMTQERPDLKPLLGKKLTVMAWLWARTVKSPNPAYSHIEVPLASTFMLSTKPEKEAYIEPVIEGSDYRFTVKMGKPQNAEAAKNGTKLSRGANFQCLISGTPITGDYVKAEGKAGRMGVRLMALVAAGPRGRVYLPPTCGSEALISGAKPVWKPEQELIGKSGDQLPLYGMSNYWQVFSPRQLLALTTFCDLVQEARDRVKHDSMAAGLDDGEPLATGGNAAAAYADAVGVYLAFAVDKACEGSTTLCTWSPLPSKLHVVSTFGRQALQMTWDYAEANPFADSSGNILRMCELAADVLDKQYLIPVIPGSCHQLDAAKLQSTIPKIISTDPPYYDNIAYADLSDFFYVWLRRSLKPVFPDLFATLAVPKAEELVASLYRHNTKEKAEAFFLDGMTEAMRRLAEQSHPSFPVTIYYAFKQAENDGADGTASTGWETFLDAVTRAGFAITGTWPMRTERAGGFRNKDQNALSSSIILVCRQRDSEALTISRREFLRELNAILPEALLDMTLGGVNSPVAPVDLSQAIIGPGMAIFSKYAAVLEADGKPMTVRTALQLINRFLAEDDFDHGTQFCMHWFDQNGWAEGKFGEADVLARAKGTSVDGVSAAGIIESGKGIVRLLRYNEYPSDWSPDKDTRKGVWEALHHLIRALQKEGEGSAGGLLAHMPAHIEPVRQLAYRLYTLCERKGWAEDARAYNELIASWQAIEGAAAQTSAPKGGVQIPIDF